MNYLTNKYGSNHIKNFITAEAIYDQEWGEPNTVLDYSITSTDITSQFVSKGEIDSNYITFHFLFNSIFLTDYTWRFRTDSDGASPISWKILGSNGDDDWFEIDSVENQYQYLQIKGSEHTFHCKTPSLCKHVKIQLTAATYNGKYRLHISRIEFFGEIEKLSSIECKKSIFINFSLFITIFI